MTAHLDLRRINELQGLMGEELGEIVASLVRTISAALERVERALGAGDLADATAGAHHARNDALLIGARDLLAALSDVETAARQGRLAAACIAFARTEELWPETRRELEHLVRP